MLRLPHNRTTANRHGNASTKGDLTYQHVHITFFVSVTIELTSRQCSAYRTGAV